MEKISPANDPRMQESLAKVIGFRRELVRNQTGVAH